MAMRTAHLTRDLPKTADLVIIGGGIIGAATAFFAARAGLRAVVVERRPMLGTLTTPAATGAFRAQFDNPEEIALVSESIALYANFAEVAELPDYDIGMHQQGYLWLARREETLQRQRELVAQQCEWGLNDVELLDGDEARRRFPYLGENILGARYRAGDGWLDVRKLLMGYAIASDATFVVEAEVTGILGGQWACAWREYESRRDRGGSCGYCRWAILAGRGCARRDRDTAQLRTAPAADYAGGARDAAGWADDHRRGDRRALASLAARRAPALDLAHRACWPTVGGYADDLGLRVWAAQS